MAVFTKLALPLAVVLFLIAGFCLVRARAADRFADILYAGDISETVRIDGTVYVVDRGDVHGGSKEIRGVARLPALSLAYQVALARTDPILALAGTDPTAMRRAVDALATSSAQLAALQASPRDRTLVAESLYPIDFLRAAADLEESRQRFLTSGSNTDAAHYSAQLRSAVGEYARSIAQFKRSFDTVVTAAASPYATETERITPASLREALDTLSRRTIALRLEIAQRTLCVHSITMFCSMDELQPHVGTATDSQHPGPVIERVRAAFEGAGTLSRVTHPLTIALSSSACVRSDIAPFYVLNPSGNPLERVVFIGDLRFVDTSAHKDVPLYTYFAEHGISYAPSQPTSYYECPEFASDWGRVFALAALGSTFHATSSISETRVNAALSQKFHDPSLSPAERHVLEEQTLALGNASAGFDTVIAAIAVSEKLNAARAQVRANDAATLFYTRSAFLALFLASDRSVAPRLTSGTPNTALRTDEPFVWLSSIPASMDSELVHSIARFRTLSEL